MYSKKEKTENASPAFLRKGRALGKLLRQHEKLKDRRHPMFERNRFMKFLMYFMLVYYAGCLLMLGFTLPIPMGQVYHGVAGFHVLDGWFFILIIIDFWVRFILQETPANLTRPYSLLPISKNYLMRRYLRRAGLSIGNLAWAFFLVPFAFMSVMPAMGFAGVMGWLVGWWLLFVMNSYIYLLIRALCTRKMWWIVLPILVHVGIVLLAILPEKNVLDMPCTNFMYGFAKWEFNSFLCVIALIVLFFRLNGRVQGAIVYDEVGKKEDIKVNNTRQYSFLNRFGIVGEYLKLEMKMKTRNRLIKTQFYTLLGCMLLLSALLYFSNIYDGVFMTNFICLYDYIVPGMTTLITIMCHEGNYMDLLMSRKESILDLLTAKYYFHTALLLLPFTLLLPLMFIGKISIWMNLGYLFLTAGVLYPIMFQMAAYNKETMQLNAKLGARASNGAQSVVTLLLMFLPIAFQHLSVSLLGDVWGYVVLIVLGAIGVIMHRRWLRFTYQRFMKKRYTNMEGFRATRK